ncbi:SMP-30/gluconolactonase/LRE family protein [Rhodococcus qingshengii]|uniref:SMP-30/gluconolactonase/LRE family protein n=1 Tax=Rhodococcus qingshengii TaxID=334542 RepID=UPI0021BB9C88|nr:SMP-30/gluconolactonase/LRE family protein [Rhodococcus qingshengii]MEA1794633.1 SMP-30/gluconolactonase/LRE family protein [Rhodococcus qingshengii]UXF66502.1 SMP-30/gluconolactonase/LRE family protein [Rhodococcus qingshengii]
MAPEVAVVLEGYTYFECPRWHENRIWVSDFYTYQVISACEDGTDIRVEAEVPGQPSGLGWLPDGRLLVVSMRDQKILRRESDGELVVHADLSGYVSANVNDMLVDAQGRAYVGNFGFDLMNLAPVETADLLRVDPDGSVHVVARDLHFPNGMALTSTGDLLVDETLGNRISAFAVQADGSLGERRDWASFGPVPGGPEIETTLAQIVVAADGCCIDGDDSMWVADALGSRVLHVGASGEIVDEIAFDSGVFACGLGGSDGRTLFVCAAPDFNEHARKVATEGKLLSIRLEPLS